MWRVHRNEKKKEKGGKEKEKERREKGEEHEEREIRGLAPAREGECSNNERNGAL